MARDKGREKVSFMVPSYLLELADMQAQKMGLDRYDVLRMAIGEGLMNLRVNTEIRENPQAYKDELIALTNSEPGAYDRLTKKVGDNVVAAIKKQKEQRDAA